VKFTLYRDKILFKAQMYFLVNQVRIIFYLDGRYSVQKRNRHHQEINHSINKNEFLNILNENKDEYLKLGILEDFNGAYGKFENNNINSLNTDLSSLLLSLFLQTKFENSKPYKMIDYILNNDNNYLSSQIDKDNFEEIKRTVYNKPNDSKESLHTVFKSLFQYFKADFTNSYLFKIFDCCNQIIQEIYRPSFSDTRSSNFYKEINYTEKKDKFTYQNYLSEKLRNNYNNDIMSELNDNEMWRSLIYLCNKNFKHSNKNAVKIEKDLSNLVKTNIEFLSSEQFNLKNNQNFIRSKFFRNLRNKIVDNKYYKKFILRKLIKMLPIVPIKIKYSTNEEKILMRRLITKLLDLFSKEKEDDYDKILKKIVKFESKNDDVVSNRDPRSFWIQFKFFFYLKTITSNKNLYMTDEKFWMCVQEYITENSHLLHNLSLSIKQGLGKSGNAIKKR
jgi:hypothetical protein